MYKIDARGEACPKPVLMTKTAVNNGEAEIETLVDNAIAVSNLERFAQSAGYKFSSKEDSGIFAVTLIKDNSACPAAVSDEETLAVFITENRLGSAQNELSTNLMRMFIYTLTQMDKAPKVITFMNEGVQLPCEDEQIIENLKVLIASGTKVMVCGTCLNFYKISEKLGCGTVSNMYEILESVSSCSKTIKL